MKKQFLLLVALFAFLLNVNAQNNVSKNDESTRLYQVVEQMPEFLVDIKNL